MLTLANKDFEASNDQGHIEKYIHFEWKEISALQIKRNIIREIELILKRERTKQKFHN